MLLKQSLKKRAQNKLAKLGSSLKKQELEKARTETMQFGFSKTKRILALLMSCSFAIVGKLAMRIFGSSMKRKRETPSSSCSKPKPAKAFSESTDEEEAAEDLSQELQSLYTSGKVSASKNASLIKKTFRTGLEIKGPFTRNLRLRKALARHVKSRKPKEKGLGVAESKNAARTWQRWLRKQNAWGSLYWADIPMQNPRPKEVACGRLPFLLPHEWVAAYLQQAGAWEEGKPEVGSSLAKTVEEVCAAWKRQPWSMFPLGLRGDGVPVQGNLRRSTVDFLTINLPGSQKNAAKRVPVTCLETKYSAGQTTTQAILEVLAWSLKQLGKAEYPKLRHDGGSLDKARAQKAGVRMPAVAALVEMRGDWDWNSKWYGAPTYNELTGMCWLCKAKPAEWRAMTSEERKKQEPAEGRMGGGTQAQKESSVTTLCPAWNQQCFHEA